MSGRGRKQPKRGGQSRRSQPGAKKDGGPSRSTATDTMPVARPQRQQPARGAAGSPTAEGEPGGDVRPRRPQLPRSGTGSGSGRASWQARAERKRRTQRLGVIIGAMALGGAAIGGTVAGMAGGAQPAGKSAAVSSSAPASPAVITTTPAAPPPPPPPPVAISCPTGGGATTTFGHDILVPAPYRVTITYGDGDNYSNDSGHLGAVFSHTYAKPGTYTVRAEVTGSAGGPAAATCTYTWGR